jgi:peptidoglycan-N-acetylglucosamine deacetylase
MDADHPYRLAVDASAPDGASIVELPIQWALDDWEAYAYLPGITGSGWIARPSELLERWTLELEALAVEGGLFVLTNHPFLSGRPSRAAALATLIERAKAIDGLWIGTCREIADWTASLPLEPVVHRTPVVDPR